MDLFGLIPRNDWELWHLALPDKFTEESLILAEPDLMAKFDTPYIIFPVENCEPFHYYGYLFYRIDSGYWMNLLPG
jgi:hypothetical protein